MLRGYSRVCCYVTTSILIYQLAVQVEQVWHMDQLASVWVVTPGVFLIALPHEATVALDLSHGRELWDLYSICRVAFQFLRAETMKRVTSQLSIADGMASLQQVGWHSPQVLT